MAVSEGVKKREDRSAKIIASLETNEDAIGDAVFEELSPYREEGEVLEADSVRVTMRCLRRRAKDHTVDMRKADEEHNRELGEDSETRKALDLDKETAYEHLRDFKDAALRAHGPGFLKAMQVQGSTPRDSLSVTRQLRLILAWLDNPEKELPPVVSAFVASIDREKSATLLRTSLEALEGSSESLSRELRESEGTMLAKHKTMDRYDRTEVETTGVVSHLMLIAGMDEEANRLRPSLAARAASGSTDELPVDESTDPPPPDDAPTDDGA